MAKFNLLGACFSTIKQFVKRHIECFGWVLASPVRWIVERILARKRLFVLYRVWGTGLGDTLAMSTVLNVLQQREAVRGIIFSKVPALFENNPQVAWNLDHNRMPKLVRSSLKRFCKYMRGRRVICIGREAWVLGARPWRSRQARGDSYLTDLVPDWPSGLGSLKSALPVIVLGGDEMRRHGARFRELPEHFGIVKATSGATRTAGMVLKNWLVERMQAVVSSAEATPFPWIQVGDAAEPALDGTINLLGRTSLRETLYLISRARVVLTIEGFISHAAAALGRPLVIVFSGYHDPDWFYYGSALKVLANPMPPCAPCDAVVCGTPGKPCSSNISVQDVVAAVREALRADAPPHEAVAGVAGAAGAH